MINARLATIPCIQSTQLSETRIRIKAADGHRLIASRPHPSSNWIFDQADEPTQMAHFHLRFLVHQALNP